MSFNINNFHPQPQQMYQYGNNNGMVDQMSMASMSSSMNSSASSFSSFDVAAEMKKHYASKAALRNKRKWKKPRGKPKRPLSAYNIFFKSEREKMVKAQKKVGFANMAKEISKSWKALDKDGRKEFVEAAEIEQKRYRESVKEWKAQSKAEMEQMAAQVTAANNQSDPIILRRLLLEQQMLEQQKLIVESAMRLAQHQSNGVGGVDHRRSSMPHVPASNDMVAALSGGSAMQQQLPADHTMPLQPPSASRRFSIPMDLLKPEAARSGVADFHSSASSYESSTYDSTYESTDDSTLDDETADMLINMPIMDIEQQAEAEGKQPPQTLMIPEGLQPGGRRSSMPTMTVNGPLPDLKASDENLTSFRRLSMPIMNEEVAEMQDIMDMLRDEDGLGETFASKTPSAA